MAEDFTGVWTAIITPFNEDGSVDWDGFDALVGIQAASGVTGIVVGGTTGEFPTLSVQENLSLIRRAKASHGNSLKIMAGVGGNNTEQVVELSKLADESGADMLLAVTPPYNKPGLEGLKAHFSAVCRSQSKPVCLYHVPGRTAQKLTHLELAQLVTLPQVTMVKEASGDMALFSRATLHSGQDSLYLSGDDLTYLASLSVGGRGVISVVANVIPKAYVALQQAFVEGNVQRALDIHNATIDFAAALFVEPNPCPLKAVLSHLGLCKNSFRLPLVPVSKANHEMVVDLYERTLSALEKIGIQESTH